MIETDAPYLTPHKKIVQPQLTRKHRNEPWTLPYTAKALAKATGTELSVLIEQTTANAEQFFQL